jgi:hypothetical protein
MGNKGSAGCLVLVVFEINIVQYYCNEHAGALILKIILQLQESKVFPSFHKRASLQDAGDGFLRNVRGFKILPERAGVKVNLMIWNHEPTESYIGH